MKLYDVLYNWLQIKVVAEARPNDHAAQETYQLFSQILSEEYKVQIENIEIDDSMYCVTYLYEGVKKRQMYDQAAVEFLLSNLKEEPNLPS